MADPVPDTGNGLFGFHQRGQLGIFLFPNGRLRRPPDAGRSTDAGTFCHQRSYPGHFVRHRLVRRQRSAAGLGSGNGNVDPAL